MKAFRHCPPALIISAISTGTAALASSWILRHTEPSTPVRALLALLPGPFFIWFVLVELKVVRAMDEFQRRVILDSLAIAFPVAITIGVVVEGLQKGGFITTWGVGDVWPFMALAWLPSLWIANRRYPRDDAEE